jgi:peptidoglycan/LPS O-acetylase OafA/YrhL
MASTSLSEERQRAVAVRAPRELYIDRLRSVMTALVILHHTAIVYGGSGGWFWKERELSADPSSLLLTLMCATDQAYFMGFFFLLAGYFTPRSLERKGYAEFLKDRFLRLGLPLLGFILILGPLTAGIVEANTGGHFWPTIAWLWQHQRIINGPLWFAQALLIFSLAYWVWRAFFGMKLEKAARDEKRLPGFRGWFLAAIGVGVGAVALRQIVPVGENVFGLQIAYFSSYIFLFALGIAAWRHDWLRQLTWAKARVWVVIAALVWPMMPLAIVVAGKINGVGHTNFSGGYSWPALVYAFWEPFLAWGVMAALLLFFRARMNQASKVWEWIDRRAYAAYVLHPPVLVGWSLALHGWDAPPLVKFAVCGSLAVWTTWLVSDPFVRMPGLRRIL